MASSSNSGESLPITSKRSRGLSDPATSFTPSSSTNSANSTFKFIASKYNSNDTTSKSTGDKPNKRRRTTANESATSLPNNHVPQFQHPVNPLDSFSANTFSNAFSFTPTPFQQPTFPSQQPTFPSVSSVPYQNDPIPKPPIATRTAGDIRKSLELVAKFVQMEGFQSIAEMYRELHDSDTSESEILLGEVKTSWESSPRLLGLLDTHHKKSSRLFPHFQGAAVASATAIMAREVERFSNCQIEKRHKKNGVWDNTSRKSSLHLNPSEVTPEFFKGEVLQDIYTDLKDPKFGIPLFMNFIDGIVSSPTRSPMTAMGVATLLYAKNRNLRKAQSMVGMVLAQASVTENVIIQFNHMGLSVGLGGIKTLRGPPPQVDGETSEAQRGRESP